MNLPRVRIKICGITRTEDALAAANLGVDAIGLVFYPQSPRAITANTARTICAALPPFVCKVGLFVDADETDIRAVLDSVPLDVLQFHGNEPPEACQRYGKPFIKAIRMQDNIRADDVAGLYQNASGILLDAYREGVAGGTGAVFDWSRIPAGLDFPLILAGGLTASNVGQAIHQVRPYAVDVSGGVESAKGIKDAGKIAEFIQEVRHAEIQYSRSE